MNFEDFRSVKKKFRTNHRDDMYHILAENDVTGMFKGMPGTFMVSFAIGFHQDMAQKLEPGAINHVNATSIDFADQDIIILLMLERYPDLKDPAELWDKVEEYAEYGITALYNSMRLSEWVLDVQSIIGDEQSEQNR